MQQAAKELFDRRRAILEKTVETLRHRFPWSTPHSLSFDDAVYLISLFRAGAAEDLSYVGPHVTYASSLSPCSQFDARILEQLYRREIIAIHPGSSGDSMEFAGNEFKSFIPFKVHWLLPTPLNGPSPSRYLEELEGLLQTQEHWPDSWHDEAHALHRLVAYEECMQYLRIALEEHGFVLRPGEKLSSIVRSVLTRFSIGHAYNFIWRAAKDAAAFMVRTKANLAHAANTVPGNIQRAAEQAIAEGWEVRAYWRDRRVPESKVSHVLFTMALRLPHGGLRTVPPSAMP